LLPAALFGRRCGFGFSAIMGLKGWGAALMEGDSSQLANELIFKFIMVTI